MIEWVIIGGYVLSMTAILILSLGQLHLTWHYRQSKSKFKSIPELVSYPKVTVQLPVFNELYVIERLIDKVSQLDYPKDKLEIQLLDDSTDETTQLIADKVLDYQSLGFDIIHVRRPERSGFKAGALQYGIEHTDSEFLAIFDADFLPEKDFLKKTLPYFQNGEVGMVQTRWGHLNKDYSVLTRLQAFGLDGHFTVEQGGRNNAGSFINFNGTAGVWRKQCIQEAGGWSADTLTEDLDLSYRAQLKGWKFEYLEDIVSPAELPVIMPAIKSQQYRWNKGAAETAKKNVGRIWNAPIGKRQKTHALLHLLNNTGFIFILIASLLSVPMLIIKDANPELSLVFHMGSIFIIGFLAIAYFYWHATKKIQPDRTFRHWIVRFPMFLTFSMGLAFHNAIAVTEGYLGIKTPFIRTPKFNINGSNGSWSGNKYIKASLNFQTLIEGLISLYFVYGFYQGIALGDYGLIFFHLMLAVGFGGIFFFSIQSATYRAATAS